MEAIAVQRFGRPEIDRYFRRIRFPVELLPELDVDADFLCAGENDLEAPGRRRAARCIDRHDRGPCPLQRRRLHLRESDLPECKGRPAGLLAEGWRYAHEPDTSVGL